MFEGMSEEEKALVAEFRNKKREENEMETSISNTVSTNLANATSENIVTNTQATKAVPATTEAIVSFGVQVSKAEKFIKILERRLPKTLNELDKIANLSRTFRYVYTAEQARQLVEALEERVATIKVLLDRGVVLQEKRARK